MWSCINSVPFSAKLLGSDPIGCSVLYPGPSSSSVYNRTGLWGTWGWRVYIHRISMPKHEGNLKPYSRSHNYIEQFPQLPYSTSSSFSALSYCFNNLFANSLQFVFPTYEIIIMKFQNKQLSYLPYTFILFHLKTT